MTTDEVTVRFRLQSTVGLNGNFLLQPTDCGGFGTAKTVGTAFQINLVLLLSEN